MASPRLASVTDPERPPRGWLCTPPQGPPYPPGTLRVGPIGRELEPTLALLDALAAYDAAILSIVDEKSTDPSKKLADAFALARSAENLLRAGFGGTAMIPAADDKRLTAVTGFIDLIARVDRERVQADKLARVVEETDSQALISALRDHLRDWETARATSATLSAGIAGTLYRQAVQADRPSTAAARRQIAANWFTAQGPDRDQSLQRALDGTLGDLLTADLEFHNALGPHPRLSNAQKRRLAELTRQRLIAIFNALTAVVTAAKGV